MFAVEAGSTNTLQTRQGNTMILYTIVWSFGMRQTQGRRFEMGLRTQATTH